MMPFAEGSAFCKINLSLKLGGRRPDGYHSVRTVMQTVSLCDTLEFRPSEGPSSLVVDGLSGGIPVSGDNLVLRAVRLVLDRFASSGGYVIRLIKRIPSMAGLGGGSSDAALALRVVGGRFGMSRRELAEMAAELGSDVPFFCYGGRAECSGRGEIVRPLPDAPVKGVVIVKPPFGISTGEAYALWDSYMAENGLVPGDSGNDFEYALAGRYPLLGRLKSRLYGLGAEYASLSGSGSAVFGLFPDYERACAAAEDPFLNESGDVYRAVTVPAGS